MNKTKIEVSNEGIRLPARPCWRTCPSLILKAGDPFISLKDKDNPIFVEIPFGCIGVVHEDAIDEISVVRDDCQAARRAKAKFLKATESK